MPCDQLPKKGEVVDLASDVIASDAVFDVSLTSNCMGAAVLIYELVETLDAEFVDALCDALDVSGQHPYGRGVGLVYIEHATWGKAVLRYGSREIRLTLLLAMRLQWREVFEQALVAASAKTSHACRWTSGIGDPIPAQLRN